VWRRRRLAIIASLVVIVVAGVLWINRWRLGRTAITMADPMVRAWIARQVLQSSDGVYQLTASTIRVDEAQRRIVIDTISLTTDAAVNGRRSRPYPAVTMRFSRCAVTGIDLTALTGGQGLHALHAGCDSVTLVERTLAIPNGTTIAAQQGADSNNFLRFQGKLDLPAMLPHVAIDAIEFPHVHVSFDLLGSDGRRSSLTVDSLAVSLDSVMIDPREPVAHRRPLFSRDITVRLDRFEGSTTSAEHISLLHLRANLDRGTCRLDALVYEPSSGRRADSLGLTSVRAEHLMLSGVDWRTFLLSGDVTVGHLEIDSVRLQVVAPVRTHGRLIREAVPRHIETTLRAVGRSVRLDSLTATAVRVLEMPNVRSDSVVTNVRRLTLAHVTFGPEDARWEAPFPVGRVSLSLDGLVRRSRHSDLMVQHAMVDAASRRLVVDSLRSSPPGDDAAFLRGRPYRKSRLSLHMQGAEARDIDLTAYVRRGALRASALAVRGLVIDVMNDKSIPKGPPLTHRYPQATLRDLGIEIQVDTVIAAGMVSYREKDSAATTPGTLTFGALRVRGYNFSTDPARMTGATPFRLIGDASLMGAGALHVEWEVPLVSRDFEMHWKGSLGPMDPKALNSFLPNAMGMKFTGGEIRGVEWDAVVSKGLATGKMSPRWHDLHIGLPGVARNDSGLVGGIMRGVAKFAANAFGIRNDNDSTGGRQPMDGSITHRWLDFETLPQFTWAQLRDPLLLLLKK
jgi:hypothetical protein